MKKRLILPIAVLAALSAAPLPSPAAPVGATLTYGRITVNVCVDRTPECTKTSFSMLGSYVIAGKVYTGQIVGIADSFYSAELGKAVVPAFTLTGVSSKGSVFLDCAELVLPETQFLMSCSGHIGAGGFGYRTVLVKGKASQPAPGQTTITGNYRGVA
jgi:hypothetical protein